MTSASKATPHPSINRVIVIGHSGFVGRRVKARLEERYPGLEVKGLATRDIDLTGPDAGARLSEHFDATAAVVMCSGIKSNYGTNLENYTKNVTMAENVCRALALSSVRRFIFLSSIAVYGVDTHDEGITEESPIVPDSYYGLSKYTSECLLRLQFAADPRPLVVLRISSVYGPGESLTPPTPSGFLRTYLKGGEITLWGDGSERREFLYVDDLIAVIEQVMSSDFSGILNVGGDQPVSYRDSLAIISKILGRDLTVSHRERTKLQVDKVYDMSLLRRTAPAVTFTSLEDGLRKIRDAYTD